MRFYSHLSFWFYSCLFVGVVFLALELVGNDKVVVLAQDFAWRDNSSIESVNLEGILQTENVAIQLTCNNLIRRGDFEGSAFEVFNEWRTQNGAQAYSVVSYSGNRGAAFPAVSSSAIYQVIEAPSRVLTDTTAILKYDVAVYQKGSANPDDILYFTLSREPGGDELITKPLATGADLPDFDPISNPPEQWRPEQSVNIFEGINPLSLITPGEALRVTFHFPNGNDTEFYMDNISLTFCSTGQDIYLPIIKN